MTKLRALLAGVVIASLAFTFGVYAQVTGLTSRSLGGSETWSISMGGPQGPSFFVTSSQMRNSQGVLTTASTTGTLVMTTATASLISTAAAGGAVTVDLPPTPFDGEIFEWVNGAAGAFTTGNVVATTDGSTIQGSTATGALAAGASIEFRYALATNTWYKLR